MTYDLVSLKIMRELAHAGALRSALVVGTEGGFALQFSYGMTTKTLQAKRGHPRIFRTMDAAARTVRGLGVARLEADLAGWRPVSKTEGLGADTERARQQLRKAITTIRNRAGSLSEEDAASLADEALRFARGHG